MTASKAVRGIMLSTEPERRNIEGVSLRAASSGRMLTGYAATYGTRTVIPSLQGPFIEEIRAGAFRGILSKPDLDCVCTYNHNRDTVLGRTKSGTLRLKEDSKGLYFECDLPDTQLANDLHCSVTRGDISECSFAFSSRPEDSDWTDEEIEGRSVPVRTLKNFADLSDVSIVVHAAYKSGTSVQARGAINLESIDRPSVGLYSGRSGKGFRVTKEQVSEWRATAERTSAERRKALMDLLLS